MKTYERPTVVEFDDMAEGVFAASGDAGSSSDCWTVGGRSVQSWNGSHNVFEMSAVHSTGVTHITTQVTFVYTFSVPIDEAYAEAGFATSVSGNQVTVVRDLHANGYYSGDNVTFKVWVKSGDQATTEAIALNSISYTCRHETNVQGGID